MTKPSTSFKHPRHMTTEEAISHLFHPKAIQHVKSEMEKKPKRRKKSTTKKG
jgi:hypothetical protein